MVGEDHGRLLRDLGETMVVLCNEPPEDEAEEILCDDASGIEGDPPLAPNVPFSQFKGTISPSHSSSSLEGVIGGTDLRRKTLYGDKRCGEFVRDGGMGAGFKSHRLGR